MASRTGAAAGLAAAILAGLLTVAGVAPSPASPLERPPAVAATAPLAPVGQPAEVTGYRAASVMNPSSGPVTVWLGAPAASALAVDLNALPASGSPSCMEDALLYRIVFRRSPRSPPDFEADGYACEAVVLVRAGGKPATPRRDAACRLIAAVRRVLPASALGTQQDAVGCDAGLAGSPGDVSGRLVRAGGPAPGRPVGVHGKVTLTAELGGRRYEARAGASGTFAIGVPAGRYRVTGVSPLVTVAGEERPCRAAAAVTVRAGLATRNVEVVCSVK